MIADNLFTFFIWIIQHSILAVLPVEVASFPISQFQNTLNNISSFLSASFSGISNVFPVYILIIMTIVVISFELILVGIKGVMYIINLVRGAGA